MGYGPTVHRGIPPARMSGFADKRHYVNLLTLRRSCITSSLFRAAEIVATEFAGKNVSLAVNCQSARGALASGRPREE